MLQDVPYGKGQAEGRRGCNIGGSLHLSMLHLAFVPSFCPSVTASAQACTPSTQLLFHLNCSTGVRRWNVEMESWIPVLCHLLFLDLEQIFVPEREFGVRQKH